MSLRQPRQHMMYLALACLITGLTIPHHTASAEDAVTQMEAAAAADQPGHQYMVASANPHATRAGLEILRAGGTAIDAAIAVQAMLTLVEPQSSGIGGGAFLMYYDQETGKTTAYDGRETAPMGATEALFLKEDGTAEKKRDVIPGGRSAGVPGLLRMLALAHEEQGALPWKDLFAPAIRTATEGFAISPRFHYLVNRDKSLPLFDSSRAYFYDEDGQAKPEGHVLTNQAYADTLTTIAEEGAEAFYAGPIAEDIVKTVNEAPINPGTLSLEDMAAYEPKKREPVCAPYREWTICGMSPPSSGGIAVLQILKLLESQDLASVAPGSPEATNLFIEAARLAYADRATHLGDTDFVHVPVQGLIDQGYLDERSKMIVPGEVMKDSPAGTPPGAQTAYVTMEPGEIPATSHFSVVDGAGNVVAMTTTIESAFGNRMMVRGFLLNNQLTDFTFVPANESGPVANRVEPGKRPLSSMSPTIVFDQSGRPVATLGSPGGPLIISFVAKTLIGVLDWGMPIQDAIALPNLFPYGNNVIYERDTMDEETQQALQDMGYQTRESGLVSGLHGITIRYDDYGTRTLTGGADPRREGTAEGE